MADFKVRSPTDKDVELLKALGRACKSDGRMGFVALVFDAEGCVTMHGAERPAFAAHLEELRDDFARILDRFLARGVVTPPNLH